MASKTGRQGCTQHSGAPMARFLVATAFAFLCVGASEWSPARTIDLDRPWALAAVQRFNPAHYEKILKILDGIPRRCYAAVPRWITANFGAREATYGLIELTTFPPIRHVSFTLDDTRYEAMVTVVIVNDGCQPKGDE